MLDLLGAFNTEDLDVRERRDNILRAPFPYPGGKSRSIQEILKHLPYRSTYVEPFGGSAAVLLARNSSPLEIYNDRYGGVVAFYRCLANKEKKEQLAERLALTIHAREEFVYAKENWQNQNLMDDVERAALWFYMMNYSFAGLGRNFGRCTRGKTCMAGKILGKIEDFNRLHYRLAWVQFENQDWRHCFKDYDTKDTVYYLDPPYVDAHKGTYKYEMSIEDHRELIDTIFACKGFVAVSGYANPLYDGQSWDARYEWDSFISISPKAFTENNFKENLEDVDERVHGKEVLWIKC